MTETLRTFNATFPSFLSSKANYGRMRGASAAADGCRFVRTRAAVATQPMLNVHHMRYDKQSAN